MEDSNNGNDDKECENRVDEHNRLNISWLLEFEKTDKNFKSFYLSDVTSIHITCIYVNKSNEIESRTSCKNISFLHPNVLSREEMIYLLKKNSFLNGIRYKLSSILKYNIDIIPSDLLTNTINFQSFLHVIENIDSMYWKKTIKMFGDMNELLFVFRENVGINKHATTKKVYVNDKKSACKPTIIHECKKIEFVK